MSLLAPKREPSDIYFGSSIIYGAHHLLSMTSVIIDGIIESSFYLSDYVCKGTKKIREMQVFSPLFSSKISFFCPLQRYSVTAKILPINTPRKLYIYIYKYRFFLGKKWKNFHCNAVTA